MLSDADILSRITNVEDSTVERKVASDIRDVVKAAVAFSNSLPLGDSGIIYVGVYDDGRIEAIPKNGFQSLQKKISGELSNIYPPIYPQLLVREKDGHSFIAVIVQGSENRPHFAGKSWIRDGTQNVSASEDQFRMLIAKRNSKAYEILKSLGKLIRVDYINVDENIRHAGRIQSTVYKKVEACNAFYVTLQSDQPPHLDATPLRRVEISYDHNRDCLILEIYAL